MTRDERSAARITCTVDDTGIIRIHAQAAARALHARADVQVLHTRTVTRVLYVRSAARVLHEAAFVYHMKTGDQLKINGRLLCRGKKKSVAHYYAEEVPLPTITGPKHDDMAVFHEPFPFPIHERDRSIT